ncbi:hypothetical protein G7Y89_g11173 [Cudoniella acicularis]|uniref:Uncharacterized protein n=1 Tax=Cudoniella acicularis TaxID=354080 RepID=A0A8H4VYI6_9HELO|nr:hypothetical protein G7Y89_g11173 [Cudoniella acicularis]
MRDLQELHQSEQATIITALRCSNYIGILFNWDLNAICFENIDSIPQAKNLVLETAYAMACRVQQLLMILCHEVNQSLLRNYVQDPATIACALRIVYQSIDCCQKLELDAGSLQDLVSALKALDCYRVNLAFLRCGEKSQNVKAFQALIDAKKTPKCAISFTYQRYRTNEIFLRLPDTYSQQTYTEVLETRIVNWDTFGFKDKTSTTKSYAESVTSVSCETGSVFDAGSEHDQDITTPSLMMNKTLPEESEASHDAEIRRTEARLGNLKKLKSSERHLTDDADTHEDWVGFVEPQGPPIDVENQSRMSKMLSKVKELVSPSVTSATGVNLKKRRRHQNTSPPPPGVQTLSDLSAPPSPATKRNHDFNYELYEATN